jgi:hypothetical protein
LAGIKSDPCVSVDTTEDRNRSESLASSSEVPEENFIKHKPENQLGSPLSLSPTVSPSSSFDPPESSTSPVEGGLFSLLSIEDPQLLEDAVVKQFSDMPLSYVNPHVPDAKMHYWHTTSDPKPKMITKSHSYFGQSAAWILFPSINLKYGVQQLGLIPAAPYKISAELQDAGPNVNFGHGLEGSENVSECEDLSESLDISLLLYVLFRNLVSHSKF